MLTDQLGVVWLLDVEVDPPDHANPCSNASDEHEVVGTRHNLAD